MPLQQTSGNVTADAYGGGVAAVPNYIEEVFSCFLFNGTETSNSIVNNIDLLGKGGLVWEKQRNSVGSNLLYDTNRGAGYFLSSNSQSPSQYAAPTLTSFNSNGFTLGTNAAANGIGVTYASWTFRKKTKFFDIVSFSGSSSPQNITHNLGSVPACIFVKNISNEFVANDWCVYHQSLGATKSLFLNNTAASATSSNYWNNTSPTSSVFTVGTGINTNNSGDTYVAYLFAHNAGGFGLTGTDNVISCGSYTGTGAAGNVITLGYEPQWILAKASSGGSAGTQYWQMYDTMRGMSVGASNDAALYPNVANAEATGQNGYSPTATGFETDGSNSNLSGVQYIYIAIRRGPMKVPTDATKVFAPVAYSGSGTAQTITGTNNPVDLSILTIRDNGGSGGDKLWNDRLRGAQQTLYSNYTQAEVTQSNYVTGLNVQFGEKVGTGLPVNGSGVTYVSEMFSRAPSFFDVVCYTGDGTNQFINHNLGVRPDLYIVKRRSATANWAVTVNGVAGDSVGLLNSTNAFGGSAYDNGYLVNGTVPASNFGAGFGIVNNDAANASGSTYVAYLFATCSGVSKCTAFTGNGSTQTINCGFTSGARFVMIKATSTTGNWLIFDTARGMTTSTDPWLALNSTAAESATTGACTTTSVGFTVDESKLTGVNTNGVSYIVLAVA